MTKTVKTFLATWRPAGGVIRVVLVREVDGWLAYFCTDPQMPVATVLEAMAEAVMKEAQKTFSYQIGTMIELPRAAIRAYEIA